MGQAKRNKARLGKWYGRPIEPGHPDFVPPKKPEPIRPLLRFVPTNPIVATVETKIEGFRVYADRIEIEFVDGRCEWKDPDGPWPELPESDSENVSGRLTIGSREFGDVVLDRYTETGCVFLRPQTTREGIEGAETTEGPSGEAEAREEPILPSQRKVRSLPDRRRMLPLVALLAMTAIGNIDPGPEPLHRPRKR